MHKDNQSQGTIEPNGGGVCVKKSYTLPEAQTEAKRLNQEEPSHMWISHVCSECGNWHIIRMKHWEFIPND